LQEKPDRREVGELKEEIKNVRSSVTYSFTQMVELAKWEGLNTQVTQLMKQS
jgi:hypothetical protein